MVSHTALYISNSEDKEKLIKRIICEDLFGEFSGLNGALFSKSTLDKFMQDEVRHDKYDVLTKTNNSLVNSSEGERKIALLEHLINLNPQYLVIDNVFGNLDTNAQKSIVKTLEGLAQSIPIIQITTRKRDILPFIDKCYKIENNTPVLCKKATLLEKQTNSVFNLHLPKPYIAHVKEYDTLVKFNQVTIRYGSKCIVKNINWEIKPGEFWQLSGPNGSGKSTLLSLISGDNPKAYNQDISLFGVKKGSGESIWDIKRKIGYFSSEYLRGFERSQAIEKMIISGFFDSVGLYKKPNERQVAIAHQWLKTLNMYHLKDSSFLSLSIGHQRLVLIARAMVKQPPLLILDEPTNGLDDFDAALFTTLVNKIATETQTAILYVSHQVEENLLKPDFIYQLQPHETGSTGKYLKCN